MKYFDYETARIDAASFYVSLGDYPDRYGTRLIDGSKPSFDCNDYRWQSGTVVQR